MQMDMEIDSAFSILGIEPVKDPTQIKDAYRKQLRENNPEVNPEGFMQLRLAYELADEYATTNQDTTTNNTRSPVDIWMLKVQVVYKSIKMRLDLRSWIFLFRQDVCLDLESSVECKERLLLFLMDNYRLPQRVWKLIDDTFFISTRTEDFYEKFSREYINLIIKLASQPDEFPYDLLRGEEHASYDTFLYHYFELVQQLDARDLETAHNTLSMLDKLMIDHPYYQLAKIRYDLYNGEKESAFKTLEKLLSYTKEDANILSTALEVYVSCNKQDKALATCDKLLQFDPQHYQANKTMQDFYLSIGEYEKAKVCCSQLLKITPYDETLSETLKDINDHLIPYYKHRIANNPNLYINDSEFENALELCWCYLQNHRNTEGLSFLNTLKIHELSLYNKERELILTVEYHNLLSRFFFATDTFQLAIAECEEVIRRLSISLQKSRQLKKDAAQFDYSFFQAYEIEARCYDKLGDSGSTPYYNHALSSIQKAMRYTTNLVPCLHFQILILKKMDKLEEAFDLCNQILDIEPHSFIGYTLRQEISYEFGDAKGVIDDFYQAKKFYSDYPRIYELAMEVYLNYEQPNEAFAIYQLARDNKVESPQLKQLYSQYQKLHVGHSICEDALALLEEQDYNSALPVLLDYLQEYPDNEDVLSGIALCYQNLRDYENAFLYYQQLYSVSPDNINAIMELYDYYMIAYKHQGKQEDWEVAMSYAFKAVEILGNGQTYNNRGTLYLLTGDYENARSDFQKALKDTPDSVSAHENLGIAFKCLDEYWDAIGVLFNAIKLTSATGSLNVYRILSDCYHLMEEHSRALTLFTTYTNRYPNDVHGYIELVREYCFIGEYDQALETLNTKVQPFYDEFLEYSAYIHLLDGQALIALDYYEKLLNQAIDIKKATLLLADCYFYGLEEPENALQYYQRYFDLSQTDSIVLLDAFLPLAVCYYELGMVQDLDTLFEFYLEVVDSEFQGLDIFLDSKLYSRQRHFALGCLYLYTGDTANATAHFKEISEHKRCYNCRFPQCACNRKASAQLFESQGDTQHALKLYKQILEIDPTDLFARRKLKMLTDNNEIY